MKKMKWLAIAAALLAAPAAMADDAAYSAEAWAVVQETALVDDTMDFIQGMMIGMSPMLLADVEVLKDDLTIKDFDRDAFRADVEAAVDELDRQPVYVALATQVDERFTPAEIDAILNDDSSPAAQAWAEGAGDALKTAMESSGYQNAMEDAVGGAVEKAAADARARKAAE